VTFPGDHKQLSPVCEMNDNELSNPLNRSVILWSTSSLYCGSVFTLDKEELLDNLYSPQPEMHAISRSELRITHRFGPNLTAILGRLFYPFGFESANNLFCKQVELSII